jgi:hypothetical protein
VRAPAYQDIKRAAFRSIRWIKASRGVAQQVIAACVAISMCTYCPRRRFGADCQEIKRPADPARRRGGEGVMWLKVGWPSHARQKIVMLANPVEEEIDSLFRGERRFPVQLRGRFARIRDEDSLVARPPVAE